MSKHTCSVGVTHPLRYPFGLRGKYTILYVLPLFPEWPKKYRNYIFMGENKRGALKLWDQFGELYERHIDLFLHGSNRNVRPFI